MSRILLVFLALAALTGCPNSLPEDIIQVDSGDLRDAFDGPLIVQDGKKIPILAPVGFSEETILVRLTESADRPTDWTLQDSIKNHQGKDVTSSVGFGQMKDDIGKADYYAISLPADGSKPMWLHVATGTEVGGVFKEGTLIDIFGNQYTVTNLNFYFKRKQGGNANFTQKQTGIVVESQAASASGQIVGVKRGQYTTYNPILENGTDNLQLKFVVEADVRDAETGYERTLPFEVYCGAKFEDVPVPEFYQMFGGY